MGKTLILLLLLCALPLTGCTVLRYRDQISLLTRLAKEQSRMDAAVQLQHRNFVRLHRDIQRSERLPENLTKDKTIALYGQPLDCRPDNGREQCLYRDPSPSEPLGIAYLYFDQNHTLVSWEYESGMQW